MTSPILVTGGTGTLGRLVVRRLRESGCDVRVLSRRGHEAEDGIEFLNGDLATGEGIEAAVEGAGTIMHLRGRPQGRRGQGPQPGAGGITAGAAHLVYISVVGADRAPGRRRRRSRHVRLLRLQAGRRARGGRFRPAIHHAACDAVP